MIIPQHGRVNCSFFLRTARPPIPAAAEGPLEEGRIGALIVTRGSRAASGPAVRLLTSRVARGASNSFPSPHDDHHPDRSRLYPGLPAGLYGPCLLVSSGLAGRTRETRL